MVRCAKYAVEEVIDLFEPLAEAFQTYCKSSGDDTTFSNRWILRLWSLLDGLLCGYVLCENDVKFRDLTGGAITRYFNDYKKWRVIDKLDALNEFEEKWIAFKKTAPYAGTFNEKNKADTCFRKLRLRAMKPVK